VNLGVRADHGATDIVGTCGGTGHAGSEGCPCRKRPGAGQSGRKGGVFAPDARSPGPGRGGDSERRLPGGRVAVQQAPVMASMVTR